jgi:hypothetical protein
MGDVNRATATRNYYEDLIKRYPQGPPHRVLQPVGGTGSMQGPTLNGKPLSSYQSAVQEKLANYFNYGKMSDIYG